MAGRAAAAFPHGGHQMSLNIAAGLGLGGNESYPDLFQPFGGFADGVKVENSYVTLPDLPGIGFEAKADRSPLCAEPPKHDPLRPARTASPGPTGAEPPVFAYEPG